MAKSKKKVAEEVTTNEEVITDAWVSEDVTTEVVWEVITAESQEWVKMLEPETIEVKETKKSKAKKVKTSDIEIYYSSLITLIDFINVTDVLKKRWVSYTFYDIVDKEAEEKFNDLWVRSKFAVVIKDWEDRIVLTTWRSALTALKQYGKI